jgi:hypothetical protein
MTIARPMSLYSGVLAGVALTVASPALRAADSPRLQELKRQRVGDTTYFYLRLDPPADLHAPHIEPGPYSEAQRRQLARLPRLVPQDHTAEAVYARLEVPHFRPDVGFDARRPQPVPVRGLEFVGKVRGSGKTRFLLLYPTGDEASAADGDKAGTGLARLVRRATWAEVPLELDFARAAEVPQAVRTEKRQPSRPYLRDDLEGLWAQAQAAHLAVLEAQSPEFGFYGFACAATGRKYRVADPVLEGERLKDEQRPHRQLFELTTGTTAITQSLALRRVLGTQGRDRGERSVDVASVRGIDVAEHSWEKMLGGKRPQVEPLAGLVPHDNYYLYFQDIRKLIDFGDLLEEWGTSAARAFEGTSRDYRLRERYERQLCLRSTWLGKTLGPLVVRGVAVTGSDPYVREGSDLTVIFHVTSRQAFLAAVEQFLQEARKEHGGRLKEGKEDYHGVTVERFVTPLREVSLHRAAGGDFVIYSNSPAGLRRVLDAHRGRLKSLRGSLDFRYMRSVFPLGDRAEDGFGFLSDAFIRQLVGPASKVKEKRRLEALTSLQMVTHGAMFAAWETGKLPADYRDLLAAARLRPEHVYVPEGKGIAWDAARQVAISDVYNTLHFATPLVELPIDRITPAEERAYGEFREEYTQLWRRYFDPVGMRFSLNDRQARAEVYILPLINSNEYAALRLWTGGGTTSLDPAKLSPRALLLLTGYLNVGWPFGNALGHWAMIRLDDGAALARVAELWVRQDLSPKDRAEMQVEALPVLLRLPFTVGVAIGDAKAFDDFLRSVDDSIGPARRKTSSHNGVTITRLKFGKDSRLIKELHNYPRRVNLSSLTVYHAKVEDGWYASLSRQALEDIIDRAAARKAGKGPKGEAVPINSSLHLAPGAAVKAGDALRSYLEWETHKRALPNDALWYALYRCGLLAADAPESARQTVALKYLGFVPVSPDEVPYRFDMKTGEVVNLRHGSLRRPQLHAGLAGGSPLAKLLEQFPTLRADLRFREDGLHTVLTIARRPHAFTGPGTLPR